MTGSVNKVIRMYRDDLLSIPQVADRAGLPRSRVRSMLIEAGVALRSRTEGVRLRADDLSQMKKGRKLGPFSKEWRDNISRGRKAWGDKNAAGVSKKTNGYVQHTRGPDKHRGLHVTIMEKRLGRKILPDEVVHHIDGNPSNNNPNNLALMTRSGHSRHHRMIEGMQKCQEQ